MNVRGWLAVLVLGVSATTAPARIGLENIQAAPSALLPERKSLEYFPQEVIFFRYNVTGARTDIDGKVDIESVATLTNESGKEVATSKSPFQGALSLGGDTFVGNSYIIPKDDLPTGKYKLKVLLTDRLANDKIDFDREITIKPVEFAALHPYFSYDPDGRIPAPANGLVNQTLYFRLGVVGLDRARDRVELVSSVQILGPKGKELLPKPLETIIKETDPKVLKETSMATFTGSIGLHRPGEFILKITVTDRVVQRSTTLEVPFRVDVP
jgi:hypothetical protein